MAAVHHIWPEYPVWPASAWPDTGAVV